jgi:hypothetical protein
MAPSKLAKTACEVRMRRCLNTRQAAAASSNYGGGVFSRGYGPADVGAGAGLFQPGSRGGTGRLYCLWGRAHYGGGVW